MKIIKKGVDPDTIPLAGTCYKCKTQVEFTKGEAKYTPAYDQRESDSWSVTCPVCNGVIYGIPMHIHSAFTR